MITDGNIEVFGWPAHKDELIWHPYKTCYEDKPTHVAIITSITALKERVKCSHQVFAQNLGDGLKYPTVPICVLCHKKLRVMFEVIE